LHAPAASAATLKANSRLVIWLCNNVAPSFAGSQDAHRYPGDARDEHREPEAGHPSSEAGEHGDTGKEQAGKGDDGVEPQPALEPPRNQRGDA
jgi:hypothetical protein